MPIVIVEVVLERYTGEPCEGGDYAAFAHAVSAVWIGP